MAACIAEVWGLTTPPGVDETESVATTITPPPTSALGRPLADAPRETAIALQSPPLTAAAPESELRVLYRLIKEQHHFTTMVVYGVAVVVLILTVVLTQTFQRLAYTTETLLLLSK
jgi:hypothetical protein